MNLYNTITIIITVHTAQCTQYNFLLLLYSYTSLDFDKNAHCSLNICLAAVTEDRLP